MSLHHLGPPGATSNEVKASSSASLDDTGSDEDELLGLSLPMVTEME